MIGIERMGIPRNVKVLAVVRIGVLRKTVYNLYRNRQQILITHRYPLGRLPVYERSDRRTDIVGEPALVCRNDQETSVVQRLRPFC